METSPEERIAILRRGFESYDSGDPASALEAFDPEVEVYAGPEFINSGTFHGHQGWLEWVTRWNEAWESFVLEVRSIEAVGERHAVATVHQTGRGRGSGVEVEQTVSYLYEFRDGLGIYFAIHTDRDTAVAAARRREA